ncbi:MAG TPA: hypothetical protein VFZ34_16775 [Blastocatellia bacterium]|nr:hypothetical protein [Blastocatellia bacterium]
MTTPIKFLQKQARSLTILLVVSSVISHLVFAGRQEKPIGEIAVTGTAMVNGKAATSGMTIARGSRIQTERDGTMVVSLGRLGRVAVQTETDFFLDFQDNSLKGNLTNGTVVINVANGVVANVVTPNGEINLPVEYTPATLTVGVTSQGTHAFVRREQDRPRSFRPVERSSFDRAPSRQTGELWVTGTATVNGKPATSGMLVLRGSRIQTERDSSVVVNLGNLGRIAVQPETDFLLDFRENAIRGNLSFGNIVQDIPSGVAVNILTPNGESMVLGNQTPATLTVDLTENDLHAFVTRSFLGRSTCARELTRGLSPFGPSPNPFGGWVLPILGIGSGVGVGLVTILPDPPDLTPVAP